MATNSLFHVNLASPLPIITESRVVVANEIDPSLFCLQRLLLTMPEEAQEETERRMVAFCVKPCAGVDPEALYEKIKTTVTVDDEYKLKWDEKCKVDNGKIYASFTIELAADFDEVMEAIEYMEGEVESQEVTFMSAME